VGTVDVLPVCEARKPDFCERGQQFLVRILLSVNEEFHGRELTLHVGDQMAGRWTAGSRTRDHSFAGTCWGR